MDNRRCGNYPGDATSTVGQVVGPSALGEWLVVDTAVYDPVADSTRCVFRWAVEAEVRASAVPTVVLA